MPNIKSAIKRVKVAETKTKRNNMIKSEYKTAIKKYEVANANGDANAVELLSKAKGVKIVDDPAKFKYPMPLDTSNQDNIYVGRIREDISAKNSLVFWCAGDQIRKGAATNAVQIAELLLPELEKKSDDNSVEKKTTEKKAAAEKKPARKPCVRKSTKK